MEKNSGIVNIHGKDYMTVAKRVELWHEDLKGNNEPYSITTEVLSHDPVVIRATIKYRGREFSGVSSVPTQTTKTIEKANPYEVAETSAVGRALGFAGYGITEGIASADEMRKSGFANNSTQKSGFGLATIKQVAYIKKLLQDKGYDESRALVKYEVSDLKELTSEQASTIIENLNKLPDKTNEPEINADEVDQGIQEMFK